MTTSVALLSEATPAPQLHGRGTQSLLSAAGVHDLSALARQQLPSAVPAASLVAAFSAAIQQQLKPAPKPTTPQPSSPLAAQFIAQDQASSQEDLQIFEPRAAQPLTKQMPEDDYLHDLKIARGEVPSAAKKQVSASPAPPEAAPVRQAIEQSTRAGVSTLAAGLPALVANMLRRPNFFNARGVSAYQLTLHRNATLKQAAAT